MCLYVNTQASCCVLSLSEPTLLVRACNQLGQFLQHRETNLRYLALESMCTLASSEVSHEAVKTHIETVINALKVSPASDAFEKCFQINMKMTCTMFCFSLDHQTSCNQKAEI